MLMGGRRRQTVNASRLFGRGAALTVLFLAASCSGGFLFGVAADAQTCLSATVQVREEQPHGTQLPDCRAYEQVSPVAKNSLDALGATGIVQATPGGEGVSFFAVAPFPGTIGAGEAPTYLGARSGEEWLTEGLEALVPAGTKESVLGVTETGTAIVGVGSQQSNTPCEPAVAMCATSSESNVYLRDARTGSFQLLANQPKMVENRAASLGFADAAADGSRVLFETNAKLTPEAKTGENLSNLYEWNGTKPVAERVSLVGMVPPAGEESCGGISEPPCEAPVKGSFAGPGGPSVSRQVPRGTNWYYYTQNAISETGSRVFVSDKETGYIYMREPEAGRTVQVSGGQAFWRAATKSGLYVFYTEGLELYRFNVKRFEEEKVLTGGAREQLTTGAEGVLGVAGAAEDGEYVYFAAPGVLANNTNGQGEEALEGANNLYQWHNGELMFLVRLPGASGEENWTGKTEIGHAEGPAGGGKSSRVAADGKHLLFSSNEKLTSYNNNEHVEFYLYNAESPLSASNPVCVTCNPAGVPATGQASLTFGNNTVAFHVNPRNAFLTRNLSSDGRRVFFETEEALVPGDSNFQIKDVYEWEADGEGSCESEAQDHGCLYLISTGQSPQESYFGDAGANGDNVFFFTRQGLTTQDQDSNVDVYDARVEGGMPAQYPPPPPPPCGEEATCRQAPPSAPTVFGTPSSTTFSGAGNLVSQSSPRRPLPPRVETRRQKLLRALKACRTKSRAKRKGCEKAAHRRYGPARQKAKKASGGGHR